MTYYQKTELGTSHDYNINQFQTHREQEASSFPSLKEASGLIFVTMTFISNGQENIVLGNKCA